MQTVNSQLPLCSPCQDTGIIIDSLSSWSQLCLHKWMVKLKLHSPWELWPHGFKEVGRYHHKQESHLHIIIMFACIDGLLNYFQMKTFTEIVLRNTNYFRFINFNCRRLFPKQDKENQEYIDAAQTQFLRPHLDYTFN